MECGYPLRDPRFRANELSSVTGAFSQPIRGRDLLARRKSTDRQSRLQIRARNAGFIQIARRAPAPLRASRGASRSWSWQRGAWMIQIGVQR